MECEPVSRVGRGQVPMGSDKLGRRFNLSVGKFWKTASGELPSVVVYLAEKSLGP